ncbi:carboxypeptidase-like regulatory domain-containing protein [Pontibacter sp. HSC-14F20]|uniref:carboxypeptidase-like regulatory domain-containing protein n=1 Tax=Pontibacter sp. HSC-14F20 TaxID=2864136 RepID=UPI001C73DC2E|nr:carboxypeptidase-like regulatory domain-containing protein [Pontibacter sp. HSC-14F20]MBX0332334.1 carboxypeptidase-like regulatory domain-containing protein [Pontibacter sp. HSC-14F20]
MKRNLVVSAATFLLLLLASTATLGQHSLPIDKQVIQFSGMVYASDSVTALEGVAVYVPGTKRGTYTRKSGYFSMPVVAGDTVVFGALGYEKLYLAVPLETTEGQLTLKIVLERKENKLPTVDVMPWATEYDLRQAVLRTKLPEDPKDQLPVIPPPFVYKSIRDMPAMDAKANFRYGQKILQDQRESRYRVPDILKIFSIPIN